MKIPAYTSLTFDQLPSTSLDAESAEAQAIAGQTVESGEDAGPRLQKMLLGALPLMAQAGTMQPTLLAPANSAEVARLFLVLAAIACKSNHKDAMLGILERAASEQLGDAYSQKDFVALCETKEFRTAVAPKFEQLEATWVLQALARSKGAFVYATQIDLSDKTAGKKSVKAPLVGIDDAQVAALLAGVQSCEGLVAMVQQDDKFPQKVRKECISATHLAKLASPHGSFGISAGPQGPDLEAPGCISEFDYETLQSEAFIGSAGNQGLSLLASALVLWQGAPVRLRALLQNDAALSASVESELLSLGVVKAADILDAYRHPEHPKCEGAPQVFAVMPSNQGGPDVKLLAVVGPVAHLHEVLETRELLTVQRKNDAHANAEVQLAALVSEQAAQMSATPEGKRDKLKQAHAQALKKLEADSLKKGKGAWFLGVPTRTLTIGGTTPRNIAAGLTTAHHRANLAPVISLKKGVDRRQQIGRLVFAPGALVQVPLISRQVSLAQLKIKKADRQAFFAQLIEDATSRLLAVRDAYAAQKGGRAGSPAFAPADLEALRQSTEAWAYFIQGSSDFNHAQWRAALEPLALRVLRQVKTALHKVEEGALNEFDAQLLAQCEDYLLLNHA